MALKHTAASDWTQTEPSSPLQGSGSVGVRTRFGSGGGVGYLQPDVVCVRPAVCVSSCGFAVEELVAESAQEARNRNHKATSCGDTEAAALVGPVRSGCDTLAKQPLNVG